MPRRMLPLDTWLLFCLACVALVATPGPSIVYLVSRTLAQGRAAGFVSLVGTSAGFAIHALAAAFGLSALLAAVPLAYEVVRWPAPPISRGSPSRPGAPRNDDAPDARAQRCSRPGSSSGRDC